MLRLSHLGMSKYALYGWKCVPVWVTAHGLVTLLHHIKCIFLQNKQEYFPLVRLLQFTKVFVAIFSPIKYEVIPFTHSQCPVCTLHYDHFLLRWIEIRLFLEQPYKLSLEIRKIPSFLFYLRIIKETAL